MGSNFIDEIDCESFFDHFDDLIEFPPENECGGVGSVVDGKDFGSIWDETLPESKSLFPGSNSNSASDLSAELAVPYEDIVQLEWLSTFVEDSFAGGGMTIPKETSSVVNKEPSSNQFHTSSPVSVLESSSSTTSLCSAGKTLPLSSSHPGPHRARSKRSRRATFKPSPVIQLVSPSSSFTETPQPFVAPGFSSEFENFAESQPMKKCKSAAPETKGKKKIKSTFSSALTETGQNPTTQAVRKCLHCEITKTPQWRAGPMGPKTLCNACGVRYKSGRLFPEYRPAASPTFVPALHSNSHKKVLEMRVKITATSDVAGTAATTPAITHPELVPCNNPSLEQK